MTHPIDLPQLPPELFATLVSISADAVIVVDETQRIVFVNTSAERIFGWTATELHGRPLAVLLPPRAHGAHGAHVRKFGAEHQAPVARLMGERSSISGVRRNGEEFPAEASISCLTLDERPLYAAVLRDVSLRRRIETDLRRALAARDEMLGIVSHDLRNPVNAVKMLARSISAARDVSALPAHVLERIGVIERAADQMDALIRDLLDLTSLEAGHLRVSPEPVAVDALVTRVLETMRPLAEAGGLALTDVVAPTMPLVLADPARLGQLLGNLLGNAIKFTPSGGTVRLDVHADGRMVVFTVVDDGPGITSDQLPHVFQPFWQAGRGGARQGAGLGLPIARGIVDAHGGRIGVDSAPGRGTTIWFALPVAGGGRSTKAPTPAPA